MLRHDGMESFYLVQHRRDGVGVWRVSALEEILFGRTLAKEEGAPYRALLEPQSASSALWQRSGIHGFEDREDALAAMAACAEERPRDAFRVVYRVVSQRTSVCESVEPARAA